MTVPVEAPHDREIEVLVVPVTDGVPGVPGVPGLGGVPPAQDAPLRVQLDGVAEPGLPLKPKLAVAPGARVPFQPTLVKVKCCPLRLIEASQKEPMLAPEGRSKATDQPLIVVVPPLVTVYLPSKPEPQSETLVKVAVRGRRERGGRDHRQAE